MNKIRKYTFDGIEIQVPLQYDPKSDRYIEDYRQWIEEDVYTPLGHPILVVAEDACELGEGADCETCADCGSCRHYKRAGEHTWIGVCMNPKKRK